MRSHNGRRDYVDDSELAAALAASEASAKADEARRTEADTQIPEELKKVPALDPRTAHHLGLYHYPSVEDQQPAYFRVKIPGDGNCGFYAIALGLINLVIQDKHALSEATYSEFINLIKKPSIEQKEPESKSATARKDIEKRLEYYKSGVNPYTERQPPRLKKCIPYIRAILSEIDAGRLNKFEQLKKYICRQMEAVTDKDYFLESMMIVFGPALRKLSVSSPYNNQYKQLSPGYLEIVEQDGVDALDEQLILLAERFNFNFKSYRNNPAELSRESYESVDTNPNTIAIVFEKDHWNLLLPLTELQHPNSPFLNFPSYMLQDQTSRSGQVDENKLPESLQTLITKSRETAQQVKLLLKEVNDFAIKGVTASAPKGMADFFKFSIRILILGMRLRAYELMDPTVDLDHRTQQYLWLDENLKLLQGISSLDRVRNVFYSMTTELQARSEQTDFHVEDEVPAGYVIVEEVKSQNNDLETCCKPLYDHAKALFLKDGKYQDDKEGKENAECDWKQFEADVTKFRSVYETPLVCRTDEKNKAAELLKVYQELMEVKSEEKNKYKEIINSALKNPILQNERERWLITCVRAVLINLSFILVVPAVVNWCKNKSVLYHHKTKSVELLENAARELKNKNQI